MAKKAVWPGFYKMKRCGSRGGSRGGSATAAAVVWQSYLPKIYHGGPDIRMCVLFKREETNTVLKLSYAMNKPDRL